jgi:hypothetical protein
MLMAPRSVALTGARLPWKPPMGVRAPLTMTMELSVMLLSSLSLGYRLAVAVKVGAIVLATTAAANLKR